MSIAAGLLVAAKPAPVAAPQSAPVAVATPTTVRGGVERWRAGDHAAAVAVWRPYAEAGDADALFNLGQAYKLGRGAPRDAGMARGFYRQAALKQHLPAQANLGIILFQSGDKPEAFKWLRAAADRGEPRAQYVLGIALYNGDSIPRSPGLGYGYLLRAAAANLAQATTALGAIEPLLAPEDRTAGAAVAASIAAGAGVPAAFTARLAPKLVGGPATVALPADTVLKPGPKPVVFALPKVDVVTPAKAGVHLPNPPQVDARPRVGDGIPAGIVAGAPVATSRTAPTASLGKTESPAVRMVVEPGQTTLLTRNPAPAPPPAKPPLAQPAPAPIAQVAAKPAPAPTPIVTAAAKPAGWRVQLGAFAAKKQADAAWASVKSDHREVVADARPIFEDAGPVTRLQLGPYPSRAAARAVCTRLADAGRACFVTQG